MSEQLFNPHRQLDILRQALSSDKNKVAFLLGAGGPVSVRVKKDGETNDAPLIQDIAGLTKTVCEKLNGENIKTILNRISLPKDKKATIEDILSHVRLLIEVVGKGNIDNLGRVDLVNIEKNICEHITSAVKQELPDEETPYHQLASWIRGIPRDNPVEIFTPNYDLLIESALETKNIPYFDGFIGSRRAFFDLHSIEQENLPPRWVRLWKLHGSINWWNDLDGNVFRGHSDIDSNKQMIYPSHLKYSQSRRMPFMAMQDRLGNFLSSGQSVLITCGYSFADQHINEIIIQRLSSNPRAICFGLLYDNLDNYPEARMCAQKTTNLSLISRDAVFFGGEKKRWKINSNVAGEQYSYCVEIEETNESGNEFAKCNLGDFGVLGKFLLKQTGIAIAEEKNAE